METHDKIIDSYFPLLSQKQNKLNGVSLKTQFHFPTIHESDILAPYKFI